MTRLHHDTDLTDIQWALLAKLWARSNAVPSLLPYTFWMAAYSFSEIPSVLSDNRRSMPLASFSAADK